jgi:hypothetical protein
MNNVMIRGTGDDAPGAGQAPAAPATTLGSGACGGAAPAARRTGAIAPVAKSFAGVA